MESMIPLAIGFVGIAVTVGLHAFVTSFVASALNNYGLALHSRFEKKARALILGGTAVCLAVKHYIDILLWAAAYWYFAGHEQFDSFESAVYFSSVTYTSLGFGDIVLSGSTRLICGIQAMNGILLFGWSTALLFFLVQRFWSEEAGTNNRDLRKPTDETQ